MLKKILYIILFTFTINSCGFEVIYSKKDGLISYEEELAKIKIQKAPGRLYQELKNNLYDLFNPDLLQLEPKYYVTIDIQDSISSTFLTTTGASGRNKITITANYTFYNLKTAEKISTGTTSASDNYDIEDNRYGTYSAQEFTKNNLTKSLAQNIRNLLVNDIIETNKGKTPQDPEEDDNHSKAIIDEEELKINDTY